MIMALSHTHTIGSISSVPLPQRERTTQPGTRACDRVRLLVGACSIGAYNTASAAPNDPPSITASPKVRTCVALHADSPIGRCASRDRDRAPWDRPKLWFHQRRVSARAGALLLWRVMAEHRAAGQPFVRARPHSTRSTAAAIYLCSTVSRFRDSGSLLMCGQHAVAGSGTGLYCFVAFTTMVPEGEASPGGGAAPATSRPRC